MASAVRKPQQARSSDWPSGLASQEAEQSLVGAALLDCPMVLADESASALQPSDFFGESHAAIWSTIQRLHGAGEPVDILTVHDALRSVPAYRAAGGLEYLNDLAQAVLSARSAIRHAAIVAERSRRRAVDRIAKALQGAAAGSEAGDAYAARVAALLADLQRLQTPQPARQAIPVEWAGETPAALQAPPQIVEGVLAAGGMSMFYGESNSGKSYLAIHLAICLSRGEPWLGRRTRQGAVVYVAAEGAWSIRMRLAAYRQHYDRDVGHFGLIPVALCLMDPAADVDALVALIKAEASRLAAPVVLVVVDTVARVMVGGDENTAVDIGRVVTAGDRIRAQTGAHVLYIHHAGKDASRGARGHSSLRAALDTEVEVTADEPAGLHIAKVTKQRDLPGKGDRFCARLVPIELAVDEWGNPVTACAVVLADHAAAPAPARRVTPTERAVLGYLAGQQQGIRRRALVVALQGQGLAQPSVYRALNDLLKASMITETLGMYYLPKDQPT